MVPGRNIKHNEVWMNIFQIPTTNQSNGKKCRAQRSATYKIDNLSRRILFEYIRSRGYTYIFINKLMTVDPFKCHILNTFYLCQLIKLSKNFEAKIAKHEMKLEKNYP